MLEKLMDSPIAWGILALLAIFSSIFAIYTWLAGKSRKRFSVSCKTNEIIVAGKSSIDKLDIRYDGQSISNLSSSNFYVWNSGNTVISPYDIVSSRPLCIKNTGNAKVLNAEILKCSEETNKFSLAKVTDDVVEINFEYVDHGEGLLIQILHTGASNDLELDCKIKGGKGIVDRSPIKRKNAEHKSQIIMDAMGAMLPAIMSFGTFLLSIKLIMFIRASIELSSLIEASLTLIIMLLGFGVGLYVGAILHISINKRLHRTIPSTLLK